MAKYQVLGLMCLLTIVVGATVLRSGGAIYQGLRVSSVYIPVATVLGLGILWVIASSRKKPNDPDDSGEAEPEELRRRG